MYILCTKNWVKITCGSAAHSSRGGLDTDIVNVTPLNRNEIRICSYVVSVTTKREWVPLLGVEPYHLISMMALKLSDVNSPR